MVRKSDLLLNIMIMERLLVKVNFKVAECFVYYPTGETNKEQIKINDVPAGPFIVYFKNGHPYIQGNYKKGVLEGEYIVYSIDGNVKLKKQY